MPADPTVLLALAARAEAGGDDALSDDVWRALGWRKVAVGQFLWHHPTDQTKDCTWRPDITRSLDAVEEVPGMITTSHFYLDGRGGSCWWAIQYRGDNRTEATAPTEVLARLSAKLRALAQKESGGGE